MRKNRVDLSLSDWSKFAPFWLWMCIVNKHSYDPKVKPTDCLGLGHKLKKQILILRSLQLSKSNAKQAPSRTVMYISQTKYCQRILWKLVHSSYPRANYLHYLGLVLNTQRPKKHVSLNFTGWIMWKGIV